MSLGMDKPYLGLHAMHSQSRGEGRGSRLRGMLSATSILMILCVFSALIAGVWGVIYISLKNTKNSEQNAIRSEVRRSAAVFAEQAARSIRNIENKLDFLAYDLLRDPGPDRLKNLVDSGVIPMDMLVQIAHVDSEARTLSTQIGPDPRLTDLSDREHIRVHLDRLVDGIFIGKPVKGRVSQKWSIQITRAIKDENDRIHGVLVASMDPSYFQRFWKGSGPYKIEVELLGFDGVIRTRCTNLLYALEHKLQRPNLVANAILAREGAGLNRSDYPNARYVTTALVEGYPLVVAASVPEGIRDIGSREQQSMIVLAGLGASFVLIILGAWLSYFSANLRAREEEAVVESERLLKTIETTPNGFALFDCNEKLLLRNCALYDLFPDLCDLLDKGLAFGEAARQVGFKDSHAILNQEVAVVEDLLQFKDRSFQCRVRRTQDGGWVASWSDVTILKAQKHEAVRKAELLEKQAAVLEKLAVEARQAAAAKSAFLACMSHEIRTPLHAIISFSDLLSKGRLSRNQANYVSIIQSSGRHLVSVVDDILDFTQIQAGKLTLAEHAFDVRSLLNEAINIVAQLIGKKDIKLLLDCELETEVWVIGDRRRLLQCLLNLLSNAIKFTDRGSVILECKCDRSVGPKIGLQFKVIDTGIGIRKEMLLEVLEPFGQERLRSDALRGGTGLGLSITRDLVGLMGGSLDFQSTEGRGSEFTISLRLVKAYPAVLKAIDADEQPDLGRRQSLKILIVDDAVSARIFGKLILEKLGHKVTECPDGLEAIQLVAAKTFDVILMDIQMPEMDGLEATRHIRSLSPPKRDVYIVGVTAQALEEEVEAAKRAGMNFVISKPFDELALRKGLKEALRSGTQRLSMSCAVKEFSA